MESEERTAPVQEAAAAEAERAVNGKITVRDAKISTCDYIMDDHAH